MANDNNDTFAENTRLAVEKNFRKVLLHLGCAERPDMQKTPERFADFITEFTSKERPDLTTFAFNEPSEMIIQTGIPFYTLCEHHTLPFFGIANVAYIPHKRIIGLSKIARIVDYCSGGFQTQERLTNEIASMLSCAPGLNPQSVAVSMSGVHMCMVMRGPKAGGTVTRTNRFISMEQDSRDEFLRTVSDFKFTL